MSDSPSAGNGSTPLSSFFEVKDVYIHIPPELSATGTQLSIVGHVEICKEPGGGNVLQWRPDELSLHDVSCLYVAQADDWTLVEDDTWESPDVIIEGSTDSNLYHKIDLIVPPPIVKIGNDHKTNPVKYSKLPSSRGGPFADSVVDFKLSELKCIRELSNRPDGGTSLTFYLSDGRELPTLYFHDGGTAGLLQCLQRFLYLVRDGKNNHLIRVEESPVVVKSRMVNDKSPAVNIVHVNKHQQKDFLKEVGDILVPVAVDIGKFVRHQFRTSSDLLDKRPESTEDDEISTITCQEVHKKEGKLIDPDASLISDFQLITDLRGRLPPRASVKPRLPPLSREEWESYRQIDGHIPPEKEAEFRSRVFSGSIDPALRREVWKYLLGYFKFDSTDLERMEEQHNKAKQYDTMKNQWMSMLPEQEANSSKWRAYKNLVEKDVIRTDREVEMYQNFDSPYLKQLQDILNTYIVYNFDLGYVQGMSDLLSPILAVMENEVDTFWCFVGLMDMVQHHFEETQQTMRWRLKQLRALLNVSDPDFYQYLKEKEASNLYFAFRWLLVDFKREFSYSNLMMLWEVLWTRRLSMDYALFVALAMIDREKKLMTDPKFDFSDIIAHINGLAKNISVEDVLQRAECICRQIAAVPDLPEGLKPLVKDPLPPSHPLTLVN